MQCSQKRLKGSYPHIVLTHDQLLNEQFSEPSFPFSKFCLGFLFSSFSKRNGSLSIETLLSSCTHFMSKHVLHHVISSSSFPIKLLNKFLFGQLHRFPLHTITTPRHNTSTQQVPKLCSSANMSPAPNFLLLHVSYQHNTWDNSKTNDCYTCFWPSLPFSLSMAIHHLSSPSLTLLDQVVLVLSGWNNLKDWSVFRVLWWLGAVLQHFSFHREKQEILHSAA